MHSSTTEIRTSELGVLERPRYFARQLVTPAELNLEAAYFAERLRRHNRMLHGWGVVCGLQVCRALIANGNGAEPWKVVVRPGFAIDGHGNEISVGRERIFDLRSSALVVGPCDPDGEYEDPWCSDVWKEREPGRLWVAVCHEEKLARPVRVQPVGCGCEDTSCEYSRWQDCYELRVLDSCPESHQGPPPTPQSFVDAFEGPLPTCPPCPDDPCVVLAAVDLDAEGVVTGIDNCSCRRLIASAAPFWWRCAGAELAITSVTVSKAAPPGATDVKVTVKGTGLKETSEVDLGPGIVVKKHTVSATGILNVVVDVDADAEPGPRTLTVTTGDCSLATSPNALTVPAPVT